jgi:hypothetical protein
MKVIFLDIDGVLNSTRTSNPRKFPYVVDPPLLTRLNRLLERTGAQVVLSSTWRLDPIGILAAKHWGVPFFDICPDMPGCARSSEIIAWLTKHPDVQRFAIIDDEDDELDDLPVFQPSRKTGITQQVVDGVVNYLNGHTDKTMRANAFVRAFQNIQSFFNRDKS